MSNVDQTPPRVSLRAYSGDPFDLRIVLTVDGVAPPDLRGWVWSALIRADGQEIYFETTAETDGVTLYLRGEDTLKLSTRYASFDVTGRDPEAGEGRTILRGGILAMPRITPPLRGMVEDELARTT